MRIRGAQSVRPGQTPAATAAGPGESGEAPAATAARLRRARRRRIVVTLGLVGALLIGVNVYAAYMVTSQRNASPPRPSGIPANISTSLANLMALSPVGATKAPGFTLTDQRGRTLALSSLRGKVVVLEFMDPHCADICPIVSQEFVQAYHDLGPLASKVVFAAVNVNQYFTSVHDMAAYSAEHQLNSIPNWHFFTGPVPTLRAAWRNYHIEVHAPSRNADISHTPAVYFIDARGAERYVASPMVDYTGKGAAYLPASQLASWGHGMALLAKDLAR